jgi:hypothetical protein
MSTPTSTSSPVRPEGFASWSPRHQWRWLSASGQRLTYPEWKAALRQGAGIAAAVPDLDRHRPSPAYRGSHRR